MTRQRQPPLQTFFAQIGPFLLGTQDHAQTVQALYGSKGKTSIDAQRLEIYGRFCQTHRFEAVDSVFSACRQAVLQHQGDAAWAALVHRYFLAHPMHHFELNQNGEHLPTFLAAEAEAGRVPAFLPALADFDWWEWQVQSAPDDPADAQPDEGPLRLGSTVDVRPYAWDLLGYVKDPGATAAPAAKDGEPQLIVFWRDRSLDGRREQAHPLELLVIKAVIEGVALNQDLAKRIGVSTKLLKETAQDLLAAGILLGQPAHLAPSKRKTTSKTKSEPKRAIAPANRKRSSSGLVSD